MFLTGRFVLLLALGLVPVVLFPDPAMPWAWTGVIVALALLDVLLAGRGEAFTLTRDPVVPARAGDSTRSVVWVHNTGSRSADLRVRDAWQPSAGAEQDRHRLRLPAGATQRVVTELRPTRRGNLDAQGVTVRSVGPLGVAGRQHTTPLTGTLRAFPAHPSRKHVASRLARLRELDGRSAVRVRGAGTEFDTLREYVRGDDVRSIDWRASARNRNVVVRTWQPERDRRIAMVLDTSRVQAARIGDATRLDTSLDVALLMATLAGRAGDRVDLVVGDERVRARLRAQGRAAVNEVQDLLVPIEAHLVEANWSALVSGLTSMSRQRALVVLLTPLDPAAVLEGLLPVLPALAARHRVVLAAVTDPDLVALADRAPDADIVGPTEATYTAAAARQALAERHQVAAMLRSLGVSVIQAPPEALAPAVADHYLSLKARGLL